MVVLRGRPRYLRGCRGEMCGCRAVSSTGGWKPAGGFGEMLEWGASGVHGGAIWWSSCLLVLGGDGEQAWGPKGSHWLRRAAGSKTAVIVFPVMTTSNIPNHNLIIIITIISQGSVVNQVLTGYHLSSLSPPDCMFRNTVHQEASISFHCKASGFSLHHLFKWKMPDPKQLLVAWSDTYSHFAPLCGTSWSFLGLLILPFSPHQPFLPIFQAQPISCLLHEDLPFLPEPWIPSSKHIS